MKWPVLLLFGYVVGYLIAFVLLYMDLRQDLFWGRPFAASLTFAAFWPLYCTLSWPCAVMASVLMYFALVWSGY